MMRIAPPAAVRAAIARAMLEDEHDATIRIGSVTLRPHQRAAMRRVESLLARHGGAMLADRVGLGKTYVAAAVASRVRGDVLVVAPAALRAMWEGAIAAAAIDARIVSHEALSRGAALPGTPSLIIVDEAHRFRSPRTRRYASLANGCRSARLLLLTATPVQNGRADLAAQLALFLGRRAWLMADDELAAFVVRGIDEPAGLPRLDGPHLVSLPEGADCLEQLLALPPPLPARDEGLASALLAYGLVHQWSSSRAALLAALQRRRARAVALAAALRDGRLPSRAELSAWAAEADAVQLAFPELVTSAVGVGVGEDPQAMLATIERHGEAVARLVAILRASPDPDVDRADAILRIRAAHLGERVLAFCHYAETAAALGRLLAREGGVATLTARGARIASGRISRAEVLAQFTPGEGSNRPSAAHRIDLLIATDLLSEGLNLQEASVVIHLDLPWNPARLEQRVGRVHRIGSRHARVTVYAVAPPASAERMLAIEARLAAKLRDAQRTIGVAGRILPSIASVIDRPRSPAEEQSAIRARLAAWTGGDCDGTCNTTDCFVAAVASDRDAALACCEHGGTPMLVGIVSERATTAPAIVDELIERACGPEIEVDQSRLARTLTVIDAWLDARRGTAAIDLVAASAARSRRLALARVARALARAPRHRRAQLAPLADAARAVATAPLGEGAERILETLVASELPDEAWLRSVAAFGELNTRGGAPVASPRGRVLAVLFLTRAAGARL
ncbi:MAG TPA: DEAD/DEAH box helicase [Gemmatimonadaceae bacterium]|nr:DEAD/DEAH box helicase [Gemmatimonadaceae bacterium]